MLVNFNLMRFNYSTTLAFVSWSVYWLLIALFTSCIDQLCNLLRLNDVICENRKTAKSGDVATYKHHQITATQIFCSLILELIKSCYSQDYAYQKHIRYMTQRTQMAELNTNEVIVGCRFLVGCVVFKSQVFSWLCCV